VRLKPRVFPTFGFHPENLYAELARSKRRRPFSGRAGALVRNGDVRCVTMGQLAENSRNSGCEQNSHQASSLRDAGQLNSSSSVNRQRESVQHFSHKPRGDRAPLPAAWPSKKNESGASESHGRSPLLLDGANTNLRPDSGQLIRFRLRDPNLCVYSRGQL